jgi:hypothetical protein
MTPEKVDIPAAATLFLHTEGPGGFLLRFALVYAALAMVMQIVSIWFQAPVYEVYLRAFIENDGDIMPYMDELNAASSQANVILLLILPLSLALWVMFEAASQRRYIRAEGFRLALGADEGRLALVGLIWIALLIAGYFILVFAAMIPGVIVGLVAGAPAGMTVGLGAFLAGSAVALWLYARLSPASALTIRDRDLRFFEAWTLTKGHGRRIAASYLLIYITFLIGTLIAYGIMIFAGMAILSPVLASGSGASAADAVLAVIGQPGFWGPMLFFLFLVLMMFGVGAHALGGPAAWIVRHQTRVSGSGITDTFT